MLWMTIGLLVRATLHRLLPEEAIVASYQISHRFVDGWLLSLMGNEIRAFSYVTRSYHWFALFLAIGGALVWWLVRFAVGRRIVVEREATVALLWLLAGVVFFGALTYQAPRYFYFVSFAAPLLAVSLIYRLCEGLGHGLREGLGHGVARRARRAATRGVITA